MKGKNYNFSHKKWPNNGAIDGYAVERGSTGESTPRELRTDTDVSEAWYQDNFGDRPEPIHLKSRDARSKMQGWNLGWDWVRPWVAYYPWHVCLFVTVNFETKEVEPAGWLTLEEIDRLGTHDLFEHGTIFVPLGLPMHPLSTFNPAPVVVTPPMVSRTIPPQVSR